MRQYAFFDSEAALAEHARRALIAKKKLWIVCNGKAPVVRLKAWLCSELSGVTGEADVADADQQPGLEPIGFLLTLVTGDDDAETKRRFLTDPTAFHRDAVIVSPVMGPGTNFDEEWFDEAILLVGRRTTSDRQVFQQLNRVRQLRDKRVSVYVTPVSTRESTWDLARTLGVH